MRGRVVKRTSAVVAAITVAATALMFAANAESSVEVAIDRKNDMYERIVRLHEVRRDRRIAIHRRIDLARDRLEALASARGADDNRARYRQLRQQHVDRIKELWALERELKHTIRAKVRELRRQRIQLMTWIQSLPLERCPVDGAPVVSDNFGDIREMPGTPRHVHQGNDIMAPTGTPIIAPFDGEAVAGQSDLGGQSVHVYGAEGYVYNAHLSAYGKLGAVHAGDVIGYVGMTGNATAPHNHFEWHPSDGAAVDPFTYLLAVC